MITCPQCTSRTEGLEYMATKQGHVLYCAECGWVDEVVMPLPIIEIVIVSRIELREDRG